MPTLIKLLRTIKIWRNNWPKRTI